MHLMYLFQKYFNINYLILLMKDNLISDIFVVMLSFSPEIKKLNTPNYI